MRYLPAVILATILSNTSTAQVEEFDKMVARMTAGR